MEANQLQQYISLRIKQCRKAQHLSQEKLSEMAGLGIKAIQNIENLKYDFKIQTLEKVLTALDISIEDFFDFEMSNSPISLDQLNDSISQLPKDKKQKILTSFNEIIKTIN